VDLSVVAARSDPNFGRLCPVLANRTADTSGLPALACTGTSGGGPRPGRRDRKSVFRSAVQQTPSPRRRRPTVRPQTVWILAGQVMQDPLYQPPASWYLNLRSIERWKAKLNGSNVFIHGNRACSMRLSKPLWWHPHSADSASDSYALVRRSRLAATSGAHAAKMRLLQSSNSIVGDLLRIL